MPTRRQTIIWTNNGWFYWRIYASLGLNELTVMEFKRHINTIYPVNHSPVKNIMLGDSI